MTSVTNRRLSLIPHRSSTSSSQHSTQSNTLISTHTPLLSIELDQDDKLTIRPNKVVRGVVKLKTTKTLYSSQIRIKFRGVESACVKVKEAGLDKVERIEKITTTYFDTETLVWGNEPSAFAINCWQSIEPGEHIYKFALKLPNVNFPPSVEDPTGFSIRYIWSAYLDGPAHHPGIKSPEIVTTFRPFLVAPVNTLWTFDDTIFSKKVTPLATLKVQLPAQVFCPDQSFEATIDIHTIPADTTVGSLGYKLRKCYSGRLPLLPSGTVHRLCKRDILQTMIPLHNQTGSHVHEAVTINLPSRLLSPSFKSHYVQVYYYLILMIQFDTGKGIKRTSSHIQAEVPIGIANLSHGYLVRVPELTSVQHYQMSREAPYFFDPALEEPPLDFGCPMPQLLPPSPPPSLDDPMGLATPPFDNDDLLPPPPAYFSLAHPQFIRKERKETTKRSSCLVKPNMFPELGEPYVIEPGDDDDGW
ncbi:MAG: hypothetical protein EXX96DRAFT_591872 [Benjaminiella poitrasii]|nr:MAG: hypothetical protein EXX96DRAFT_591872 [Benjaminiella poitrasii]